jgi:hypothetical protein
VAAVVHVARLGTDLVIPPLLALAASIPVMLLAQLPPAPATAAAAAAAALIVAGALGFGAASYRRAIARVRHGPSVRVAAISVDDPFDGCPRSPAYRDGEARIGKYQPHIARAAAHGAQLIVLPEHAAIVTAQTGPGGWPRSHGGPAKPTRSWSPASSTTTSAAANW